MTDRPETLSLSRQPLSLTALATAARSKALTVQIEPAAMDRVATCRAVIDEAVARYRDKKDVEPKDLIYGVTSGFGEFKTICIDERELIDLQRNILLSHAAGVGESPDWLDPANYFPAYVVRAALIIRLNAFLQGHSGVRPELVRMIQAMLEAGVVPLVPLKGSLGSSGDLCPLAHTFAILLGHGHFHLVGRQPVPVTNSPRVNWMVAGQPVTLLPAAELWMQIHAAKLNAEVVAAVTSCEKTPVSYKEGLALANGATYSAAMLALAVHDAERLADRADAAAALTLEAVCGRVRFLDEKIHTARGLPGQITSAANMRRQIEGSRLVEWAEPVQDVYSLRCAPTVHGASRDAIDFARRTATAEINASTDNPLFFPGEVPWDAAIRAARGQTSADPFAYSAGNFHGQPLALAADFLAIAAAELANISERRTQMLLDSTHNRHLPPNLTAKPGVHSGFMLAQYTAASLVSENKVLCHPASVDSIPSAANFEDHVAMATHAARKLRSVLANVEAVLAIELLVAAQAADWRTCLLDQEMDASDKADAFAIDPNRRSPHENDPGRAEHRLKRFREMKPDGPSSRTVASLGRGSAKYYEAVRKAVPPLHEDAPLEPMIRAVRLQVMREIGP